MLNRWNFLKTGFYEGINIGRVGDATVFHDRDTSAGHFFKGLVDEVELYNRALTASEIQAIFSAGSTGEVRPTPTSGLVSRWPGDGNAHDVAGSNPGELQHGASFATGKVGQAFSLDGLNAYVAIRNSRDINTPAGACCPVWSPDGSRIAFISTRDGNDEIYVMRADGTAQTQLTTTTDHNDGRPAWSPDGTKIAFDSDRDGDPAIYVMNADGGNQTRLSRFSEAACDPKPQPFRGDDFETGDLANWCVVRGGEGSWFVYDDGESPPFPSQSDPNIPFDVPDPPQGEFAAVTDMDGPGYRILYRNMELDDAYMLRLSVFYVNGASDLRSPDTLSHDTPVANQQFRIDLLDPSASIYSLRQGDVLANIFRTSPGDANRLEPTSIAFDLSPWEGQTVRIRLATTDNQGPLRAGVDDIRLER